MKQDIINFLNQKSDDDWDTIIDYLIGDNVDKSFFEQFKHKERILKLLFEYNLFYENRIGSLIDIIKNPIETSIFRYLKNFGCLIPDTEYLGKYFINPEFHVLYLNDKTYHEIKYILIDDLSYNTENDFYITVAEPPFLKHQYHRSYIHLPLESIIVGKSLARI